MKKTIFLLIAVYLIFHLTACEESPEALSDKCLSAIKNAENEFELSDNDITSLFSKVRDNEYFENLLLSEINNLESNINDCYFGIKFAKKLENLGYNNSKFYDSVKDFFLNCRDDMFEGNSDIKIDEYISIISKYIDECTFMPDLIECLPYNETKSFIEKNCISVVTARNLGGFYDDKGNQFLGENYWYDPLSESRQSLGEIGTYLVDLSHALCGDFRMTHKIKYWYQTEATDPNNEELYLMFYKENKILDNRSAIDNFVSTVTENNTFAAEDQQGNITLFTINDGLITVLNDDLFSIKYE